MFWTLYHGIETKMAIDRVQIMQGVALGMMDHSKPEAKALLRDELEQAFGGGGSDS